ncbi:MAG: DegV family protein [Anaerolineaceae bacterium]|nr:MAG: DegV family protein [Anaerolineaceae bacterium]
MTIKIVTDSTSDLSQTIADQHDITIVPLYINFGDQSYLDGVELTREEFYKMLPDHPTPPSTSVPSVEMFQNIYQKLSAEGADQILSIHIAGSLSATADIAQSTLETLTDVPVTVFDAGQISLGTGLLAIAAAQAAVSGMTMEEIVSMLKDKALRTYSFAALDTLEYLRRSGRASRFRSTVGSLLSIKPLLSMHNGKMDVDRVRTEKGAIEWLMDHLANLHPFEEIALIHTNAPDKVEAFRQRAHPFLPSGKEPIIAEVTPIIGTHVGPGAVGFSCISKGISNL